MRTKASDSPTTQGPQQEQPDIRGEGVPLDADQPPQNAPEPPEQPLWAAPAEIDEEGALYVAEESVLRGESNTHRDGTDADREQQGSLPNDPTLQENLPFPLPREICLHIFSFLNTQELQRTALMSRQSYVLSALVRQQQFLKKHSKSHWWKFLVALADNVPGEGEKKFVEVLISGMGPNVQIPDGWRDNNATLSAYVTRWIGDFPEKIQRLGFGVSGYEDIQKRAQTLLAVMCPDNGRTQFNACTQLKDCFVLVEDKNKIVAYQQYDDLDRLFSSFILFRFIRGSQANNRLNYLINSPFSRGLTGEGLIALESQFQGIFPALVREAIRLFQIEEKQEADSQRLKAIEKLLGRLTEADILRYIDTETDKPPFILRIPLQRQIFIDALRSNYELLLTKMTIAILERLEYHNKRRKEFKDLLVVPHVVQNSLILSRIRSENILSLFNLMSECDIAEVIDKYVLLQPYCTVDLMEELLKYDTGRSKLARVFLSNKTLLNKLNDDHIVAFAENFYDTDFEVVLQSEAFLTRLQSDPTNSLLMRIAKLDKHAFLGRIALTNLSISSLLTADQTIELFNFKRLHVENALVNNNPLMSKLSSAQLLHVLKQCTDDFKLTHLVIQGRLHKFTHSDLVLLVRSRVSEYTSSDLRNYLLESLPAEIDRRVSQDIEPDYRLNSEALCKLGCVHQQLACYILDHYGDRLSTNEYVLIRDHYPLNSYDSNTPIRIAIAKDREKRLEKLERTSKVTLTNLSPAITPATTITSRKSTPPYQKTRKDPHEPKPSQETSLLSDDEWSWVYFIIQLLCIIGAVFGLLLAISGIGSAASIGIVSTITQLIFASLPMSHALALGIVGFGIFIASSIGWLAADDAKQNALTLKNKTSEVELSHKSNDAQFKKQHGIEFNYPNNPTAQQGKTTRNKEGDSSNDGAEEEMVVDRESCLKF